MQGGVYTEQKKCFTKLEQEEFATLEWRVSAT